MSSPAQFVVSIFSGGVAVGVVATGRWLMDERDRRRARKDATKQAPLKQVSYELRVAKQADEILQTTIDTLIESYDRLKEEFAQYRRDVDERRQRDLQEHERQRALDHEELDRLHQQVNDQSATIDQLKFELQGYRSAAGP